MTKNQQQMVTIHFNIAQEKAEKTKEQVLKRMEHMAEDIKRHLKYAEDGRRLSMPFDISAVATLQVMIKEHEELTGSLELMNWLLNSEKEGESK